MSVVVHIFVSPSLKSGRQALAWIDDGTIAKGGACERFPDFARALPERYPDADTLEAHGESGDDSAWSDSPLQPGPDEAIFTVGLQLANTDASFWPFVVHTAADHGLHVFDPQSGALWTPDRRVVDFEGHEEPFPPRPDPNLPPARPKHFPLGNREVLDRILDGVEPALSARGWSFHRQAERYQDWYVQRQRGALSQVLDISVYGGQSDPECMLGVGFAFHAAELEAFLREVLPEDTPRVEWVKSQRASRYAQVQAMVHELFGPLSKTIVGDTFARVGSVEELDAWIDRLRAWFDGPAGKLLDATDTLRKLNRLMLGETRRRYLSSMNGYEVLATIAMVHLADDPSIVLETAVAIARDQIDRGYARSESNHIKLLIERLEKLRPGVAGTPEG